MAPPTLCATFQKETTVPRSFKLNQCDNVLPQAGQPIPCNQPFKKLSKIMAVKEVNTQFEKPQNNMIEVRNPSKPKERNTFGLLRSETLPLQI